MLKTNNPVSLCSITQTSKNMGCEESFNIWPLSTTVSVNSRKPVGAWAYWWNHESVTCLRLVVHGLWGKEKNAFWKWKRNFEMSFIEFTRLPKECMAQKMIINLGKYSYFELFVMYFINEINVSHDCYPPPLFPNSYSLSFPCTYLLSCSHPHAG